MAKTQRVTPKAIAIVRTLEEADATLARIAEIDREVTLENTALNDKIAQLQLAVNDKLSPLLEEKEKLQQGLARFGEENKETLFSDKVRSRRLSFGDTVPQRSDLDGGYMKTRLFENDQRDAFSYNRDNSM